MHSPVRNVVVLCRQRGAENVFVYNAEYTKTISPLNWYFYALKGQHKRPFNTTTGAIFYAFTLRLNWWAFVLVFFFPISFKIPFITAASKSTANVT